MKGSSFSWTSIEMTEEYQTEYNQARINSNLKVVRIISSILIVAHLILLMIDYVLYHSGAWEDIVGYQYLFYTHVFIIIALFPIWLLSNKKKQHSFSFKNKITYSAIYLTSFWAVSVTIIDQFIHQNITVSLICSLVIATTIIFSIKERIAIFSFILGYFFIGIVFLDIDQAVKIGNLVNGTVFIFFAFVISNLIGNYHIRSFSKSCLIRDQNKLLENYNSELKQFAYIASHDLKAPLRTINSFIGLLDRTMPDKTSQQYEFMKFIQDGSANMSTLIDDLLAFTTLESEAHAEILELSDILLVVKNNLSAEITANEAIIKHPEMPRIKGVKPHFILLFQNLIGNALKYRSNDSPVIDISYLDEGDKIKFEIKDNGVGVPLAMKEKIFNLFSRGDHSKQEFKGTGLGLAICQKIISQSNGSIWVDSNGKDGSSFYFTIPVNQ